MLRRLPVLLLFLLGVSSTASAQGVLQEVRREVEGAPPPTQEATGKDDPKEENSWLDEDSEEFFGQMVFHVCLSPFLLPRVAVGDGSEVVAKFPHHPYPHGFPGYVWTGSAPLPEGVSVERLALRASIEDGSDFRGLNRLGARLWLDTTSRFGLRTSWNYYTECHCQGSQDETVIGDLMLTYRFAQSEKVLLHAGVGTRVLTDPQLTRWGFNFSYGADVFPVQPVVVSTEFNVGTLGSAGVFGARGTVGLTHRGWEVFGGYDWLRIGSVDLQGPLVGLRLWF